jgi:hypothetical protein
VETAPPARRILLHRVRRKQYCRLAAGGLAGWRLAAGGWRLAGWRLAGWRAGGWRLALLAAVGRFVNVVGRSWVFFAVWYYIIDSDCAMSADTFLASLYFSLITGTTIGYGTPELKFDGCRSAVFVIGAQAMTTTFTNAGLLGLMCVLQAA